MAARDLRTAHVRGLNGDRSDAVAHALTEEFFTTTVPSSKEPPRRVRVYDCGRLNALYDDEKREWHVVGRSWQFDTACTRRLLARVARFLQKRRRGLSIGRALDWAAESLALAYAERDRRTAPAGRTRRARKPRRELAPA